MNTLFLLSCRRELERCLVTKSGLFERELVLECLEAEREDGREEALREAMGRLSPLPPDRPKRPKPRKEFLE